MSRKAQAIDLRRRTPSQARARSKVDAILEAAAQILEKQGREALNTNRIAERAGVSISTLYQYFRDKDAILIELARRELALHRATVVGALTRSSRRADPERDRLTLRALIGASAVRSRTRIAAQETLIAHGCGAELYGAAQDIGKFLADTPEALPTDGETLSPMALFVLTRAVHGVLGALVREQVPFARSAQLEDELTRLVRGFLGARSNSPDTRAAVNQGAACRNPDSVDGPI